jgi:hypothetical protein
MAFTVTESIFSNLLKPEEKMLWSGQPKPGILFRDADMLLIPMSIILIGFAIILDFALLHYKASLFLQLFGILLAGAGLYMGLIRYFLDAAKRARTFYCITDKRVIVSVGRKKPVVSTIPLKNIDRMEITIEKDGSGFLIFGNTNPLYPWLLGGFFFTGESVPGLELLPDVKLVYNIINQQIKVPVTPSLTSVMTKGGSEDLN